MRFPLNKNYGGFCIKAEAAKKYGLDRWNEPANSAALLFANHLLIVSAHD